MTDHAGVSNLDQLTRRAVRSFWMDGVWELAIGGAFLLVGFWGMFYVQFGISGFNLDLSFGNREKFYMVGVAWVSDRTRALYLVCLGCSEKTQAYLDFTLHGPR